MSHSPWMELTTCWFPNPCLLHPAPQTWAWQEPAAPLCCAERPSRHAAGAPSPPHTLFLSPLQLFLLLLLRFAQPRSARRGEGSTKAARGQPCRLGTALGCPGWQRNRGDGGTAGTQLPGDLSWEPPTPPQSCRGHATMGPAMGPAPQPHPSPTAPSQPHPSPALCHLALPRSDLELCPAQRQLQLLCSSSPGPHSSPPVPPTSKAAENGRGGAEPQLHVPTPTQRSRQPGARRGPRRLRGSAATTAGARCFGAPTRPQPRGSGDATALGSCWGTGRGGTRKRGGHR